MRWPRKLALRLRTLLKREDVERELDEEFRFHLECQMEEAAATGLDREAARRRSRVAVGGVEQFKEECRDMRGVTWIEHVLADIRYSFQAMRQAPGFTAVVLLSLSLGIGASTAIFSLLDQIVLRNLHIVEPQRMALITAPGPDTGSGRGPRSMSYPTCRAFQAQAQAFRDVFCRALNGVALNTGERTERVIAELVSGNYFEALGAKPAMGRLFSSELDDQVYNGHPVVVLSHGYWTRRFGADPSVVGRTIRVNNYPMTVVGVSERDFTGLETVWSPEIRAPILMQPVLMPGPELMVSPWVQWVEIYGRMKPEHTLESARAGLQPLYRQLIEQELMYPAMARMTQDFRSRFASRQIQLESSATGFGGMRQGYAGSLHILMAMTGLLLLMACVNATNLLLARAVARQREAGMRLALGATRTRLAQQFLIEGLILSLIAGTLGVLLSVWIIRSLIELVASGANILVDPWPDPRILGFGIGIALIVGIVFGLGPVLHSFRADLRSVLNSATAAIAGGAMPARLRKGLVAMQVALSFVLLAGAALFVKNLEHLNAVRTGYHNIDSVIAFHADPALVENTADPFQAVQRVRGFHRELLARVRAMPGVIQASYSQAPVLAGGQPFTTVTVEGRQAGEREETNALSASVGPHYWATMGIPLLEGRFFDEHDVGLRYAVAIVNQSFARKHFGGTSPIGRRIGRGSVQGTALDIEIVGVVEDSIFGRPAAGLQPQIFFPHLQSRSFSMVTYYVQTSSRPESMFDSLRQAVRKVNAEAPVWNMRTLRNQLNAVIAAERLMALLSTAFGGFATLLTAVGLYGVLAFVVAQRTSEIGLRIALGARPLQVIWLVLREVLALIAVGLATGIPVAIGVSRLLSAVFAGLLFGTNMYAWEAAGLAVALLAAVAILAAVAPARRATAIDPVRALRQE